MVILNHVFIKTMKFGSFAFICFLCKNYAFFESVV